LRRWSAAVSGCRKGATAVEFALVVPVFLVMVMGVVEVGRVLWIKATMQHAVEQTTRYFMVNNAACVSDLATCLTSLQTYATSRLGESGMATGGFTVTAAETTISSTTYMSISVTYNFTPIVEIVEFPDVSLSALARVPYNP
jgi:Flp pilus assembly protein TadG